MCRNTHRIGFQSIALVLSATIACHPHWGSACATEELGAAAVLSGRETKAKAASRPLPTELSPSAFVVLEIRVTEEDGVSLSWSDLGSNFVYTVEYCDSLTEASWSPCSPVEQWPTAASTWMDMTVSGNGTRFYRIHTEAQHDPPSPPEDVEATAADANLVIQWSLVPGASSYNIYWSTDEKFSPLDGNKIEGVTSPYNHSGLSPGTTYYYVVSAVGNMGESEVSDVVSAALAAPALDTNVATNLFSATEFLYLGDKPKQTGVAPGTIEPRRVAVLRGKVSERDGKPLSDVTISILGHPEYGQTVTRVDGTYDMAVNGGGLLTVRYRKEGFLGAQRQVTVPWQDYLWLPDVVLIPPDDKVTTIDLSVPSPQVARGSEVSDEDGTRQATVLFPEARTAEMVFADGSRQPINTMNLRITEFTVGDSGPKAMPAELPLNTGYTYAFEVTVEEAEVAGASTVEFNEPVPFYVENFLGSPVGGIVPSGYYNEDEGLWIPSDNGRVIEILAVEGGLAVLDVEGSGQPADAEALDELGITDAERQQLAALYSPGQSLWRVPLPHFTWPWDSNYGWGAPLDALAPLLDLLSWLLDLLKDDCSPCEGGNSVIEMQNQVLGESVEIAGTPFSFHYRSDRVPGRTCAYTLDIPLSNESVPESLKRIELEIGIAGQRHHLEFDPLPNQVCPFTWDGKDHMGRTLQGTQPISIAVGNVYGGLYQEPAALKRVFGYNGNGVAMTITAREEITLWQKWHYSVGTWDATAQGLGGWTLNVHHAYDPVGRIFYPGYGGRRKANSVSNVIDTVAGYGGHELGDGGPATEAGLSQPSGLAVAADGSLYISDRLQRIRRVRPDGIIETVVGTGVSGYNGDGIPATEAQLAEPRDVAFGPDGSLYIADERNNRIRRVGLDGIITTVAGIGGPGAYGGDGGPATEAQLNHPYAVDVGPDGSLYIADSQNDRVRRVSPDGTMTTFAGTGERGFSGDEGPASEAQLNRPSGVAVGLDGSVLIVDTYNNRVRRVGTDGIITTAAGGGHIGINEGGLATETSLECVSVAAGSDGSFYIAGYAGYGQVRIYRVSADGIINTAAGGIGGSFGGDGGPAVGSAFMWVDGIAAGPDGIIYISDSGNHRVRAVTPPHSGFGYGDIAVPSEDASQIHRFDQFGRHLSTVNALNGATLYEFAYDEQGRLITIENGDGDTTMIERNPEGRPIAIIGPCGQRTRLTLNGDGYLEAITDSMDHAYGFTYTNDGLLKALTDPRENTSRFTYDERGRLIKDENPAGGYTELERTEGDNSYTVTVTTGENRTSSYKVEALSTREIRRINSWGCCGQTEAIIRPDASTEIKYADGTVLTEVQGPDPRFGMEASLIRDLTISTPDGREYRSTADRTVDPIAAAGPSNLITLTNTVDINGRIHTSVYDNASRSITGATPEGRQAVATLDQQGRLLEIQIAGLEPFILEYDDHGRVGKAAYGTRQTQLAYDEATGYLKSSTNPLEHSTTYVRDSIGRLTSLTCPDGTTWSYEYDPVGNLLVLTEPDGTTQHKLTYTPLNFLETYRSPLGAEESFSYDKDRRLVQRQFPSSVGVEWVYNDSGQLATVRTPEGDGDFTYDAGSGRLIEEMSRDGQAISYSYDGRLITQAAWSGLATGTVAYAYNDDLRVSRIDYAGTNLPLQYDEDGLLIGVGDITLVRDAAIGLLSGLNDGEFQIAYSHNSYGELSSVTATRGSTFYEVHYARDVMGRISQKIETIEGARHTWDYEYDSLGQLIQVSRDAEEIELYTYDRIGNRTGMRNTFTGQDLASSDFDYDADNKLLTAGEASYDYDADGRLHQVAEGTSITTYHYNTDGTLSGADLPDGRQITYQYDARGRRIARSDDGVRTHSWIYGRGLMPLAEYDGGGNLRTVFIYAVGETPVAMVREGSTHRIVSDHLGSPRLVVDNAGSLVKKIDYDSFGNVVSDTNPTFDLPIGFAGGMADPDHELLRFGARDYQPSVARWTTRDPALIAGGLNLYRYVGNDPVNRTDRIGLDGPGACSRSITKQRHRLTLGDFNIFGAWYIEKVAINRALIIESQARLQMIALEKTGGSKEEMYRLLKGVKIQGYRNTLFGIDSGGAYAVIYLSDEATKNVEAKQQIVEASGEAVYWLDGQLQWSEDPEVGRGEQAGVPGGDFF